MKPESNKPSINPAMLVISVILVAVAVALWWTITVVSVVLITLAVVLIIPTLCSGMLVPLEQTSAKGTRKEKSSGIDIERILKFETGVFEAREKKQKESEPARSITTREFLSEFDLRIPLDVLDGIDEKMKKRLRKSRIEDVSALSKADVKQVSTRSDLEIELCQSLIADAKGIIQGARISSIFDLAMANPDEVLTKVTRAVNSEFISIPDKHNFTLPKIANWIDRANNIISTFDVDEIQKLIEKQDK